MKKYNIYDDNNKKYLEAYCKEYNVDKDKVGLVPMIFIRDKYILDYDNIEKKLENYICNRTSSTKKLDYNTVIKNFESKKISSISIIQVIMAALINGINPCSISMILFLLILLNNKSKALLKMGLGFCMGKVLVSFLIGTVLYRFFRYMSSFYIINIVNVIFTVLFIVLFVINMYDYIVVKQGKYGKIKAQLPTKFRKINHNVIKNTIEKFIDSKWIILICIILGGIVSCTEFLCAGQLYLSTIVTVINSNSGGVMQAIMYLLVYCIMCVMPLVVIVLIMAKGVKEIEVSTFFTEHIDKIKLIYACTFFIMAIYMISQVI